MGWSVRERVKTPLRELGEFVFMGPFFNEET